jgi:hypothetical protein
MWPTLPHNREDPQEPTPPESAVAINRDIQVSRPLVFKKAGAAAAKRELIQSAAKKNFNKAAKPKKFKQARLDKRGDTPIIKAIVNDDLAALKKALKEGYDPNQCGRNSYGASPMHLAAQGRDIEMVKALIKAGAKVEREALDVSINYMIGNHRGKPANERIDFVLVDAWKKQGGDVTELSNQLHCAAHAGDAELVEKLVNCGADINHKREYARPYTLEKGEMTPVMCAIGGEGDTIEMTRAMLVLGADKQEAMNYALGRRRYGDDAFAATPMGALLTAAVQHNTLLTKDEAKHAAHEGLIDDMLKNPPPGLKYSGRPINRKAVEAHLKRRR